MFNKYNHGIKSKQIVVVITFYHFMFAGLLRKAEKEPTGVTFVPKNGEWNEKSGRVSDKIHIIYLKGIYPTWTQCFPLSANT